MNLLSVCVKSAESQVLLQTNWIRINEDDPRNLYFQFAYQALTSTIWEAGLVELEASQVALVVKNPPVNSGDIRDAGLIPGSGRSPGGRHDNPLQYSCLENPMDRGAWQATVHRVTKSQTQLKRLSSHTHTLLVHLWNGTCVICLFLSNYHLGNITSSQPSIS